jgi:hypothetical protein
MKIIFDSEQKTANRIIIDTDWTTARKYLELIWEDMTINPFSDDAEKEQQELFKQLYTEKDVEEKPKKFVSLKECPTLYNKHETIVGRSLKDIKTCKERILNEINELCTGKASGPAVKGIAETIIQDNFGEL